MRHASSMARWVALLMLVAGLTAPASALTVALAPGAGTTQLQASVFSGDDGLGFPVTVEPVALPTSGQVLGFPLFPPMAATLDYDLGDAGFELGFDLARSDIEEDSAAVRAKIFFTVDQTVAYDLSGAFDVADPGGQVAVLNVVLEDLTAGTNLALSLGHNNGTVNWSVVLAEGPNLLEGSLQGMLLPGHDYRFDVEALLYTDPFGGPTDQGYVATGSGFVTLALPEPGALALLGVAAATLAALRRSRAA